VASLSTCDRVPTSLCLCRRTSKSVVRLSKRNCFYTLNRLIIRAMVLWIITFVTGVSLTLAQPSTELLHIQASRGIFRLEHEEVVLRAGQERPEARVISDGTAFPVRHNGQIFLVTARHVAALPYDLRARVPTRRNDTGMTEVVVLYIQKESWVFHEQGPSEQREGSTTIRFFGVDVAVTRLTDFKDRAFVVFGSCDPCQSEESSQLATTDPTPPVSVFVTGFPGDLGLSLPEQRPLFRSGIVALLVDARVLAIGGAFVDEKSFVIDRRVQGGNSGSPVFSMNPFSGQIILVGLVSATSEAGDVTIAAPASRIRETINRADTYLPPVAARWLLPPQ
jgi:hypothetical protein